MLGPWKISWIPHLLQIIYIALRSRLLFATMKRTLKIQTCILENKFFDLSDPEAIEVFGEAFGPELERLKNASPTAESSPSDTAEVFSKAFKPELKQLKNTSPTTVSSPTDTAEVLNNENASPSQRLFGGDYIEVNRTVLGMLALKWLMVGDHGDYEAFTWQQTPAVKLRPESFAELRKLFQDGLQDPKDIYALLVAMVVNDLGKDSDLAKAVIARVGDSLAKQNHDMIVYAAAKAGMIPLLDDFDAARKADLMLGLQFGSGLNAAQLAQAENVPANLKGALLMKGHDRAFSIKYMELLLDVAGADGHLGARGAKAMIEPVFQSFMTTRRVLQDIVAGKCDLRAGYDQVLTQRQEMLVKDGFEPLSVKKPRDRALLRLLTMSRTASKSQAKQISEAFDNLPERTQTALIEGLSVDGYNDGTAILPYYIPALFAETIRNTAKSNDEQQVAALSSVMRFLTRVYHGTKPMPGKVGAVVECDLSFAQGIVKSLDFKADPFILDEEKIPE